MSDGPGAERWRDLTLERAVLGSVLLFPEIAARYREAGLTPALFSHPAHTAIWSAAQSLAAEGARPDFPLLRRRLEDRGTLEEVGGPVYLARLLDDGLRPDAANIPSHVSELVTLARCRRAYYATVTLREALAADPDSINNGLLGKFVAAVDEVEGVRAYEPFSLSWQDAALRVADEPARETLLGSTWLARGEVGLEHGQPRGGKTWTCLELGLAVATATPAFGRADLTGAGVPVLYVTNEDRLASVVDRVRSLLAGRGLSAAPHFRLACGGIDLDDDGTWRALVADVQAADARLVICDPIRGLTGAADGTPRDWRPFGLKIRRLATDLRLAVLLSGHDVKPSADGRDARSRAHRASGGGLLATCDAPVAVERVDETTSLLVPDLWKHGPTPGAFTVQRVHEAGGAVTWRTEAVAGANVSEAGLETRILGVLRDSAGLSGSGVCKLVQGRRESVFVALERLAQAGRIDSVDLPRGRRWFVR